jgi:protein subunit release factor B
MIPVTSRIQTDESEVTEGFVRASGPDGRSVDTLAA